MFIDLSELLLHKKSDQKFDAAIEMESYELSGSTYPFKKKDALDLTISALSDSKIYIECNINVTLIMPCDRCLEDVDVNIESQVAKEIDILSQEESDLFEDKLFDVEKFVYKEILIELPMKVLCKETCKGICNRCGTNLNRKTCDCDTTQLDPRMAKVLDVFKDFKEV
ncbi:MAG: DUF177 domain-containing protein [Lachnospiraceae bacterium]|nr:DUF177 domain-containing protein [Lachnospiraceae bacterium]